MFSLAVLACQTCTVKDRNFKDHAWFTMVMYGHVHTFITIQLFTLDNYVITCKTDDGFLTTLTTLFIIIELCFIQRNTYCVQGYSVLKKCWFDAV